MTNIEKWFASDYLDNGQWGVLSESNEIIVGAASRITKERAEQIAEEHNEFWRYQKAMSTK